jgi:hypothetical protein
MVGPRFYLSRFYGQCFGLFTDRFDVGAAAAKPMEVRRIVSKRRFFMTVQAQMNDTVLITIEQAQARGLSPLTLAQSPDTELPIGDGTSSRRYIEWLATEQERITRYGDRQAEIVKDDKGDVSLWVNLVAA